MNINSVVFNDSLTHIGNYSFMNNDINILNLPNSLISVGESAFEGNLITTVNVEENANKITFGEDWSSILKVNFEGNSYQNNCFVITDTTLNKYESYCNGNVDLSVSINGVDITSIGDNAFNSAVVNNIILSDNITNIGNSAFKNNNILSINLPNNLTSIGSNAFENTSLLNITIPSSVETIGNNAFIDNNDLIINVQGKINESGFTSVGDNWYGTATVNYGG